MAEETTLTLEEINTNDSLNSLGAMAGDKIVDGKLERVFSTPEDKLGQTLSSADIIGNKSLQDLGAEEGDRIVDDRLVRTKQQSMSQAYRYGRSKGEQEGMMDYGTDWLTVNFPTAGVMIDYGIDRLFPTIKPTDYQLKKRARGYQGADEKYGEGFSDAEPAQRREMMLRAKERELQKEFKGYTPEGGGMQVMGELYGSLKDPSTFLPAGPGLQGAKAIAKTVGIAGVTGGVYSNVQDMATKGEVDWGKTGMIAGASAAFPLGIVGAKAAAPIVGKGLSKAGEGVGSLYTSKTSKKTVNKAQAIIADKRSKGVKVTDSEEDIKMIADSLDISVKRLEGSFKAQGVKPRFYKTADEAEKALQAAIVEDSSMLRTVSEGADNLLGVISTRMMNTDKRLFGRLMETEMNLHKNTAEYLHRTKPFITSLQKMPEKAKEELNHVLRTKTRQDAKVWMNERGYTDLHNSFDEVNSVLDDLGVVLNDAGHKVDIEDYFPTSVKNYDKMRNALGDENHTIVDTALEEAAKAKRKRVENLTQNERDRAVERALRNKEGYVGTKAQIKRMHIDEAKAKKVEKGLKADLTPDERDRVIERVLKNQAPTGDRGLKNVKQRKLANEDVSVDLMQHYRTPEEALQTYITSSVSHIERKKFFGKSVVDNAADESGIDLSSSIDQLVKDANLDAAGAKELQSIVSARFNADHGIMHGGLSTVKNLGYIGTLGDFMSTMTQLTDTTNIMGYHGMWNTVKAGASVAKEGTKRIASRIKGKEHVADEGIVNLRDVGMEDNIARELGEGGNFSKVLDKVLSATQFKRIDRFGKETLMNAVKNKYVKQLNPKNVKGVQKFKDKWGEIYGPDIDKLVNDLQTGKKTELTNLHFFTKLSEHQPISYSEYPAAYLNNPNGRIFYMLKSFTLKQYDLARRNIYNEMKGASKVEKAKLMAKATKIGLFMAAGGLGVDKTKDFMLGREVKPEDLPGDAVWSLMGAFGVNKYAGDKYLKHGDVTGFADNLMTVPIPVFKGMEYLLTGDGDNLSKNIPGVGRMIHSHFGGGKEKFNKKLNKGTTRGSRTNDRGSRSSR